VAKRLSDEQRASRRVYARAYYRRSGTKESRAAWRDQNRQKIRDDQRRYHERRVAKNPNFGKEARDRRRARLKGAAGRHTLDDWKLILAKFDNECAFCGTRDAVNKDHLVPLCRGGTDWPENLVPACKTCNETKGGRDPVVAISRIATAGRAPRLLDYLKSSLALPGNRVRRSYEKVSSDALLTEAKRIKAAFGKLTVELLNAHSRYASSTYERRFGGMTGLRKTIQC